MKDYIFSVLCGLLFFVGVWLLTCYVPAMPVETRTSFISRSSQGSNRIHLTLTATHEYDDVIWEQISKIEQTAQENISKETSGFWTNVSYLAGALIDPPLIEEEDKSTRLVLLFLLPDGRRYRLQDWTVLNTTFTIS